MACRAILPSRDKHFLLKNGIVGRKAKLYIIFASMKLSAVIFDMDGLLIDSEPLWQEAGSEAMSQVGITLTQEQYHSSTGLRTPEWIDHWFSHFGLNKEGTPQMIRDIEAAALQKIMEKGMAMEGVHFIMEFFQQRGFRIGLASSSPRILIEAVVEKLGIGQYLSAYRSAEGLAFGKPHPEVFLQCAAALHRAGRECICFEDSFNGLIAAKAARMQCVVVPAPLQRDESRWDAADLKLNSLTEFGEKELNYLLEK